ncbi:hypothetical protein ACO1O0_002511 [Amphichorda felina]
MLTVLISLCLLAVAATWVPQGRTETNTIRRRDTPGCGNKHDFVGKTRKFSIESSGGKRFYHVHLPDDYDPTSETPLLMAYHGHGQRSTNFQEVSDFSNQDVNPGMITVYPTGRRLAWEGASYSEPGVSDLQFTTDLVDRLKNDFCVNDARIYAVGHSNGGGFVNTLACSTEHGAQFAAFAGVASALYTDLQGNKSCSPSRSPLPVFEAHGTKDEVIPYEGGKATGGRVPAIPEWVGRWAERNQCSSPEKHDLPKNVVDESFTCDGRHGLQRHVRLDGHNHSYPDAEDSQLFVTPMIVDFLNAQKHPNSKVSEPSGAPRKFIGGVAMYMTRLVEYLRLSRAQALISN